MPAEMVHYCHERGIATITLDSPHNRNALSFQLRSELADWLETALSDAQIRVIVLAHTGSVFCSGMDLKDPTDGDQAMHEFATILRQVWTSPKPVLAKVAGPARAGGLGLIAACDIAVAIPSATFAFTEVRIGVTPAVISATVLPRLLPHAAHELFLTGETFDAFRAVEIGLLNSCVATEELDAAIDKYASMLLLGAPHALAITKQLLHKQQLGDFDGNLTEMTQLSARLFSSAEGREGIAAFREKRPPFWIEGRE